MLPLLVLVGSIAGAWYLLIVRPQHGRHNTHQELVSRLGVGDHVMTVGGIYGRVVSIEGSSVVIELAPGVASRVVLDGIARIVPPGEARLPVAEADDMELQGTVREHTAHQATRQTLPTHSQVMDDMTHPDGQPPRHEPHGAPVPRPSHVPVEGYQPPLPPFQAVQPFPSSPEPGDTTTFRAHVEPARRLSLPTFSPRPWSAQPTSARPRAPHALALSTPPPAAPHGYAPQAEAQVRQPHHAQPPLQQYVDPQQYAPQTAPHPTPQPLLQSAYAQPSPYGEQSPYGSPQPAPTTMHGPVPQRYGMPQHQVVPQPYVPQPVHAPPMQQVHAVPAGADLQQDVPALGPDHERQARTSRAPQGMGSNLRLDDPSIAETMTRVRAERAQLAEEYRRLAAPLVAVEPVHQLDHDQHRYAAVAAGHGAGADGSLFAVAGAPAPSATEQYPSPVVPPPHVAHGVPRPGVYGHAGPTDPAESHAFQRPAPYSVAGSATTATA